MRDETPFFERLSTRALVRWLVLSRGILTAVFWTLFLALWALAAEAGLAWLGWYALVVYTLMLAPLLILQAMLIADLFAYVVIGEVFAFSALVDLTNEWIRKHPDGIPMTLGMRVGSFFGNSTPLSSLATWSLVVLARIPESAHADIRGTVGRREAEMKTAVYDSARARLKIA